ncbi:MAG: hypothetical protein HQM11_13635 [SAR324 cluster bacterium]|nr:hypothetical protein [SAR324 cluster bacterium]
MRQWFNLLLFNSVKDLFKYKSFFLLVFLLIIADRVLKIYVKIDRSSLNLPDFKALGINAAPYVFDELPGAIFNLLTDSRTLAVGLGLFFLKQIISMWPSSDMRRMHRHEREKFGLLGSLTYLRWQQMAWDAIAVSAICGVVVLWSLLGFGVSWLGWNHSGSPYWLLFLGGFLFLAIPLLMAGFSFSSKLAVISRGSFPEKLHLFFQLFLNWQVFWKSWVFFLIRVVVELIFVALIPLLVLLLVENFWLRLFLASLSATPIYSWLKMASFKFFLEIYRSFPHVYEEYQQYYKEDL